MLPQNQLYIAPFEFELISDRVLDVPEIGEMNSFSLLVTVGAVLIKSECG